ncbi:MAG: redoxin domain-containing protein [Anaerolineales bacterium]|nr:redoxin domain-containing protein [Anaerolineales bacterium]
MAQVKIDTPAPDFTLRDFQGENVRLSDFEGRKNVVLVFNRGFT